MTWTADYSGTVTPVIGTETSLFAADSTNGTYQLEFDLGNLQLGDLVEARLYTAILSGGAMRQAQKATFAGGLLTSPIKIAFPFASDQSILCTIKQIGGTITETLTGTVPYGAVGTGQTSGATCLVQPLGGGNAATTSTQVLMTPIQQVVTFSSSVPTITYASNKLGAATPGIFSLAPGAVMPAGLNAGQLYWVIAAGLTTSVFEVSATLGGSAIQPSTAGSGTIYWNFTDNFTASEAVWCTTSSNMVTMGAAANGRAIPWKILRI